jgi:hypothetical protein
MTPDGPLRAASPMTAIRLGAMVSIVVALLVASYMVGKASGPDETTLTVQVSSADHEMEEGYFSLGDSATVMVKPGTDLYRFLAGKRGHAVRITLSDAARPAPSTLER